MAIPGSYCSPVSLSSLLVLLWSIMVLLLGQKEVYIILILLKNPSTRKAEAGGLPVQGHPGLQSKKDLVSKRRRRRRRRWRRRRRKEEEGTDLGMLPEPLVQRVSVLRQLWRWPSSLLSLSRDMERKVCPGNWCHCLKKKKKKQLCYTSYPWKLTSPFKYKSEPKDHPKMRKTTHLKKKFQNRAIDFWRNRVLNRMP